jgi:hypothetical protein
MITAAWDIQGIPQGDMSGSWCVCKTRVQCVFESGREPGVHYFEFSGFNEFFEIWMVFCVVRTEKRSFRVDIAAYDYGYVSMRPNETLKILPKCGSVFGSGIGRDVYV